MSDLDQLREVGQLLRQPAFEELLETRRRRTRRARVATASTLAVAATAAVVVLAATGNNLRTDQPPVGPSPTPTPTEHVEIPAGQQTVTPDIGPGDVTGFDVLATVTNSQPEHRGDSELSATVAIHTEFQFYATYCRGGSDLWFFYDIGDGGGGSDQCSPDADTTLAPPADISETASPPGGTESRNVRMWVARPSAAWVDCKEAEAHGKISDNPACDVVPQPIVDPPADFGFRIYEDQPRVVLHLLDDQGNGEPYHFAALSGINGVAWIIDRAVVAAPDAERLAFDLSASDSGYLVDVYTGRGPHRELCLEQHADELPDWESTDHNVYAAAEDKVCGVDVRLVVDGTSVSPDKDPHASGHFMELGAQLSSGVGHEVVVEVVDGDPRNIQFAVVVRTRTQMP
jgi:hypothetical protein